MPLSLHPCIAYYTTLNWIDLDEEGFKTCKCPRLSLCKLWFEQRILVMVIIHLRR
jgi:hypothetical protein